MAATCSTREPAKSPTMHTKSPRVATRGMIKTSLTAVCIKKGELGSAAIGTSIMAKTPMKRMDPIMSDRFRKNSAANPSELSFDLVLGATTVMAIEDPSCDKHMSEG